jgi:hypothetical protein
MIQSPTEVDKAMEQLNVEDVLGGNIWTVTADASSAATSQASPTESL